MKGCSLTIDEAVGDDGEAVAYIYAACMQL